MADWLDEKDQAFRARKDAARLSAAHQRHVTETIEARAREALDAIVEAVSRDVERYREKVKDDDDRRVDFTAKPSGGFILDKPIFPSVHLECTLDTAAHVIRAEYALANSQSSGARTRSIRINIALGQADDLVLTTPERGVLPNMAEVSRYLIEPVLFPG